MAIILKTDSAVLNNSAIDLHSAVKLMTHESITVGNFPQRLFPVYRISRNFIETLPSVPSDMRLISIFFDFLITVDSLFVGSE